MNEGSWCHVFPEGRVWQNWRFENNEPRLGPFKIGVGKILAHCTHTPIIIPIYHKYMDEIIPEKLPSGNEINKKKKTKRVMPPASLIPKIINKKVEVFIVKPVDLQSKINNFKQLYPNALDLWSPTIPEAVSFYTELTNDIRIEMLKLEAEAWNRDNVIIETQVEVVNTDTIGEVAL